MSDARHWRGRQLAVGWVATLGTAALVRWVLQVGTYRAALEDGRVMHLGGVWPRSFATLMTVVGFTLAVGVMGWFTWDWITGRKARAARRISETAGHRRIVM